MLTSQQNVPRTIFVQISSTIIEKSINIFLIYFCLRGSRTEVPERVTLREVWMEQNGTVEGASDLAIEYNGALYLWSHARTSGYPEGVFRATNISVRPGGTFVPLTVDGAAKMVLKLTRFTVNGFGNVRTNDLTITTENFTIDLSGNVNIYCF